ncbi:Histone chaperone asf1 [Bachmanniomyces sp. S44760]|nr:Histone chaperone asf1 [Bachmanniomyces sp. S44760]
MSVVSLLGVKVLNNPANFSDAYEFEITFECLEQLQKDLEWKLTYVGSATSSEHDQELDSLLVGPIPIGVNKFIFEADAPNLKFIPTSEILGVTVILLTCSYDGREFVRVGYYVNNEYDSEELNNEPPVKPVMERVRRNVLAEKPRVTRFAIKWDSDDSAPAEFPPEQPEADVVEDDGAAYGAEERELEEALIKEEAALKAAEGEDEEMGGVESEALAPASASATTAAPNGEASIKAEEDDDEGSDAGSEDLEADSSGSEDEELEEEDGEGEGEGDEDMEMGEDTEQKAAEPETKKEQHIGQHQTGEVMVH